MIYGYGDREVAAPLVKQDYLNQSDAFDKQITRQFNLPDVEGHELSSIAPIKQMSRTLQKEDSIQPAAVECEEAAVTRIDNIDEGVAA